MNALTISRTEGIEQITLNRPEVRNALDDALIGDLSAWAERASEDQEIRAAVLSGAGRVFCAGADIEWMRRAIAFGREENRADAERMALMLDRLDRLPFPSIARVHGAALGGGAGLAAVCDIVIASDETLFGFTEVKLGILPAVISPYVVAKIGASAARALFLTGERFTAARALAIGLAHRVVPHAELDATVDACVQEIVTASPSAVRAAKALLREVTGSRIDALTPITTAAIADQRVSPEGQEGLRAFLERRKAAWVRE